MDAWLNLRLLSHPLNWLIVALVLIFAFNAARVIRANASSYLPSFTAQGK